MVENGAKTRFRDILRKLQGVCTGGSEGSEIKIFRLTLHFMTIPKFWNGTHKNLELTSPPTMMPENVCLGKGVELLKISTVLVMEIDAKTSRSKETSKIK